MIKKTCKSFKRISIYRKYQKDPIKLERAVVTTVICRQILKFKRVIITKTRLFKYIENFTSKKKKKISDKNADIFHISAQNIDCGYSLEPPRRGGSNEYPQSMFLSRNKKNNVHTCKPQFYCIKVGLKGVKII